jgi:hypothetical protein
MLCVAAVVLLGICILIGWWISKQRKEAEEAGDYLKKGTENHVLDAFLFPDKTVKNVIIWSPARKAEVARFQYLGHSQDAQARNWIVIAKKQKFFGYLVPKFIKKRMPKIFYVIGKIVYDTEFLKPDGIMFLTGAGKKGTDKNMIIFADDCERRVNDAHYPTFEIANAYVDVPILTKDKDGKLIPMEEAIITPKAKKGKKLTGKEPIKYKMQKLSVLKTARLTYGYIEDKLAWMKMGQDVFRLSRAREQKELIDANIRAVQGAPELHHIETMARSQNGNPPGM